MVLHVYCRDAYAKQGAVKYPLPHAKYINGNQGAVTWYFTAPDGNRHENLSLFHSLTCTHNNNVILDYYGVW